MNDHAQYIRDRAAEFGVLAATTTEPMAAQHFHELALLCRESAERLQRHAKGRGLASFVTD
ncbi:MAG: hypothetical protein ACLQJR_31375 [Stellaceae bacterium]